MFGAVVIIIMILVAIFAPLLAPYDPYETDMQNSLAPPSASALAGYRSHRSGYPQPSHIRQPHLAHRRAERRRGRVWCWAALLGTAAGFLGGMVRARHHAGHRHPHGDTHVLLALTLAAVLGGGLKNVVIAISISMIPPFARLMFAQTLTIKERDYVSSLRSMGATRSRTVFGHIMPNAYPAVLVFGTMMIGSAILGEAGLSYLGIGITPPGAAWGAMVSRRVSLSAHQSHDVDRAWRLHHARWCSRSTWWATGCGTCSTPGLRGTM